MYKIEREHKSPNLMGKPRMQLLEFQRFFPSFLDANDVIIKISRRILTETTFTSESENA